jgi:hypothetical protein
MKALQRVAAVFWQQPQLKRSCRGLWNSLSDVALTRKFPLFSSSDEKRALLGWGMFLSQTRARIKNRIQAGLQRYNRTVD